MYEPNHFLLDCHLSSDHFPTDKQLVSEQAAIVERMLLEGLMVQYAFSVEKGKWWAIVQADTEWNARELAAHLPLCEPESLEVAPLSQYSCNETTGFSLN